MMKPFARKVRVILFFMGAMALLCGSLSQRTAAQGFGAIKKDTHLYRRRPPEIFIQPSSLSVRLASGGDPQANAYAGTVRYAIENLLRTNGGELARRALDLSAVIGSGSTRFVLDNQNPEAIVYYSITGFSNTSNWKKKTEYEKVKVGEKEEWDEKKQKVKKKDVYETLAVTYNYQELTASASVKLAVRDARTRELIGTCAVSSRYQKEFKEGVGAPQDRELFTKLLGGLEDDLAACLFQTGEEVRVLLPKGKFVDTSEMIEKGQLDAARKSLEALPPMKNPQDEAYRTYSFGAISEVLAYKTVDLQVAQQYLQEAARKYTSAFDVKPDEKYFQDARLRVEGSLRLYATLEKQANRSDNVAKNRGNPADQPTVRSEPASNETAEKLPPVATAIVNRESQASDKLAGKKLIPQPLVSSTDRQPPAPQTSAMTNEVIVKLVKAGLSEENIIATINEAPATNFDLSPNAQVQLIQAGVTNRIISAMRQAKKAK